jgi:hypothetical protein
MSLFNSSGRSPGSTTFTGADCFKEIGREDGARLDGLISDTADPNKFASVFAKPIVGMDRRRRGTSRASSKSPLAQNRAP